MTATPGRGRMQNADRAVIEFITARSANYPVAGRQGATIEFRAHEVPLTEPHSCTPSCTPGECNSCTPLVNNRAHAAEPDQGLIFFSSGSSSRCATSMS